MVIIPLPAYGFDPTEAAIPWQYLTDRKIEVVFATPDGTPAAADDRLLTGHGFGIFKHFLMADTTARTAYQAMLKTPAFQHPLAYADISVAEYDGLLLPGGHDKGMRVYLESTILRRVIAQFFTTKKLVGAICHGTIAAARATSPATGRSVLTDYKTTSLLNLQELSAYQLTRLWLGDYYRTYPETVENEVKSMLANPANFIHGSHPFTRDTATDTKRSLVVVDRNYISSRWPGDAHKFAKTYYEHLTKKGR
ncbi:type 1 glutamine amidotransferase domain-containing protein [Furfurilactobacillus sp. WILCCON 0119]